MRRVTRLASLLTLGLILLASSACPKQGSSPDGKTPETKAKAKSEIELPDPLPLPTEPALASWIESPQKAVDMLAPYSPIPVDVRTVVEQALLGLTEPALAQEVAAAVNLLQPLSNVVLDDQEIIRLSLLAEGRAALTERFAKLEAVGEFGAVALPKRPDAGGREWLAWIDEGDGGVLVLGNSLEGLATARQLQAKYGQDPIFFTADPSAMPLPVDVPLARVSGRGDLNHVVIEARVTAGQDPLAGIPIAAGTLGGLLGGANIVAGASSRYADYQDTVRDITGRINAEVHELPFLVRGIGEDLAAKFNTLARTWDGRVLVAVGPAKHVRLAYGANDVAKSEVATIRLLQSVVDNVSVIRKFTTQVPKISLRRRVAKGGGEDVEMLVIHDAHTLVPAELRPLLDDERKLNVAMGWSERAGGGLIVVGPQADSQLAAWLDEAAAAPDHSTTAAQLVAASFAGEPAQLRELLANASGALDVTTLLGLDGSGPKWRVEVTARGKDLYVIDLHTPGPSKPARAK